MELPFIKKVSCFLQLIPLNVWLFIILCAMMFFKGVGGGEYQYFSYSKQFINPSWIPGSFSLNEFASTRIVYQLIIGALLQIFNFQVLSVLLKLVLFYLFAQILKKIFNELNFSKIESMFILALFLFTNQSFFGKEWIFGGAEPKLFAYLFLFYATYYLLKHQLQKAYLFVMLSTLFHLMAGGWYFIIITLYFIFIKEKNVIRYGFFYYFLPLLPYMVYLVHGFVNQPNCNEILGKSVDWIYVYFRLPHHLGIFHEQSHFLDKQLPGIITSIIVFIILFFCKKKIQSNTIKLLANLVIIILIENIFFVLVAAFDKYYLHETGGMLLKYYPFRMSSIALFFTLIIFNDLIKNLPFYLHIRKGIRIMMVFFLIFFVSLRSFNNIKKYKVSSKYLETYSEVTDFIQQNTSAKSNFLLYKIPYFDIEHNVFFNLAERESVFCMKFTPAVNDKICEWYQRFCEIYKGEIDPGYLPEVIKNYEVDYILCPENIELPHLKSIYVNQKYRLYQTKR